MYFVTDMNLFVLRIGKMEVLKLFNVIILCVCLISTGKGKFLLVETGTTESGNDYDSTVISEGGIWRIGKENDNNWKDAKGDDYSWKDVKGNDHNWKGGQGNDHTWKGAKGNDYRQGWSQWRPPPKHNHHIPA